MEELIHEELVVILFIAMIMIIMMVKKMIMWIRLKLFRSLFLFYISPPPPRTSLRHPFHLQVTLKEGCLIYFAGSFPCYSHLSW